MTERNISPTESVSDPDALDWIDIETVKAISGLSVSGVYRSAQAGTFPKPVKLSPKVSRWFRHEVIAWRDERIAERDRRAA